MSTEIQPGLVSVIVPTYNRARLVRAAVQSILAQTYKNFEIVVVDDGSTDDTKSALDGIDPRVRYIAQANAGAAAARNTAMARARGEFFAFLDSDDEWLPWKLEAEVALMRHHPDAALVWTDMSAIGLDGELVAERYLRTYYSAYDLVRIEEWMAPAAMPRKIAAIAPAGVAGAPLRKGELFPALFLGNLVHTSTLLMRREVIARAGVFNVTMPCAEDYDLWLRASRGAKYLFLDVPSIRYRIDGDDRLTNPRKQRAIAHVNLTIVRRWADEAARTGKLPVSAIRARKAEVLSWVGTTELEAGSWPTAGYFLRSLWQRPAQPRTMMLLALGLLPPGMVRAARAMKRRLREHSRTPLGAERVGVRPTNSAV